MAKCGACDKDKSKGSGSTMKGQTSSFRLRPPGTAPFLLKDVSELEARALLSRMGGGTLEKASS